MRSDMAEDAPAVRMGPTFEQDWPGASARATECVMNAVLLGDLFVEALGRLLRPYRLSPATAQVLSILDGAGEPLPHHVISQRLLVSRGTVTWLVTALEKRGLVRRIAHPSDRRAVLVELTAAGAALHQRFRPLIHRLDQQVVADLTPQEQDTLIELLGRMQAQAR